MVNTDMGNQEEIRRLQAHIQLPLPAVGENGFLVCQHLQKVSLMTRGCPFY